MANVSRRTPAAAAAPSSRKTKKTAPSSRTTEKTAPAVAAASSRTTKTAAVAAPSPPPAKQKAPATAEVIEIPASPTPSVSFRKKKKNGERKRAPSPAAPLELDDIEMWTPRQKRRIDEECCILSTDRLAADEAPVVVPAAVANDDVAVVAERGKVACRDYPHPRYACAKYRFATTPHERYCEQCFCYVCDIAAPCATWKGHARYGHCHASDKDNAWKTMRGVTRRKQCNT